MKQHARHQADTGGGDHHAGGRQQSRGPDGDGNETALGFQPTVEQDNGQRQAAEKIRQVEIVEADADQAIAPGQHAEAQKNQQQRICVVSTKILMHARLREGQPVHSR
jgi:hypothetical protein